jgi:hypothetical protein
MSGSENMKIYRVRDALRMNRPQLGWLVVALFFAAGVTSASASTSITFDSGNELWTNCKLTPIFIVKDM